MKIGIVADTHGLLRKEVLAEFDGVDHILHAGDVGSTDVLAGLESVAPVTAVWGNVDGPELRERLPEVARLQLAGVRVVVVHGSQVGSPTPARIVARHPDADMVVFGHSHRAVIERVGGTLAVNPGSAGRRRFRDPVAVAIAEVLDGIARAEVVDLTPDNADTRP